MGKKERGITNGWWGFGIEGENYLDHTVIIALARRIMVEKCREIYANCETLNFVGIVAKFRNRNG